LEPAEEFITVRSLSTQEPSMNRLICLTLFAIAVVASHSPAVHAQNSAPSSHFVFDDNFAGDILINEVRVPKSGEATYTYYEALGWRGKGAGYAGIQAHPKSHLFIFSIWDHNEHTAPIKAVHRGPGTETVRFGGEGTGLKSWNFDLDWSTDVWYTLVARNWPVGDHTYFGFWSRAGDTQKWTHLVTMDVAAKATFEGGTDAFIEDWSNTGAKPRTTHLRGGWKRKSDGSWFPFGVGRYSVNAWDLDAGKRSYNFRTNWNGGVQRDETGEFYFMLSGGADSKATTANPSKFSIKRTETEPAFETLRIRDIKLALTDDKTLSVSWEVDDTTLPPFAYDIKVFDNEAGRGEPLATASSTVPHARSATVDVSSLKLSGGRYFVRLECNDILDRRSEVTVQPLPSMSN
jgi:hypothetical protein